MKEILFITETKFLE